MLTATAAEMVDTDQPNSSRSGSMSTPGTARNAAAPISARKVTAATHQAGWIREVRVGSAVVTEQILPTGAPRNQWPEGQPVQGSGHVREGRVRARRVRARRVGARRARG